MGSGKTNEINSEGIGYFDSFSFSKHANALQKRLHRLFLNQPQTIARTISKSGPQLLTIKPNCREKN